MTMFEGVDPPAPLQSGRASIVIPCHNYGMYLAEAIESALGQTYPDVEVIVLDDGSTDDTPEVAARYPSIRFVRHENRGLPATLNRGIALAQGEFIAFLDADDRLRPEAIRAGVASLQNCSDCALTAGRYEIIDDAGRRLPGPRGAQPDGDPRLAVFRGYWIGPPVTALFRTEMVRGAGEFRDLRPCADLDLVFRLAAEHSVACHDEVVADYRRHPSNESRDGAAMLAAGIRIRRSIAEESSSSRIRHLLESEGIPAARRYWADIAFDGMVANLRRRDPAAASDLAVLLVHAPGPTIVRLARATWRRFLRGAGLQANRRLPDVD